MELKVVVYLAPEQLETLKSAIEYSFGRKKPKRKKKA